jgi:hypothetical protein
MPPRSRVLDDGKIGVRRRRSTVGDRQGIGTSGQDDDPHFDDERRGNEGAAEDEQ